MYVKVMFFFSAVIKVTKFYFSHSDCRGLPEMFSYKRVIYFFSCHNNLVPLDTLCLFCKGSSAILYVLKFVILDIM